MPIPRPSFLPRSRQLRLVLLILAVALPALVLAVTGVLLTMRIGHQVEVDARRYHKYVAALVAEVFERELVDQLRDSIASAETAARETGDLEAVRRALATRVRLYEAPYVLPFEELNDAAARPVDGRLLLYGEDPSRRRHHPYAIMLLDGPNGVTLCGAGYWFNPRAFLSITLRDVVVERLPNKAGMYGAIEQLRDLSVSVVDDDGHEFARMREAAFPESAVEHPMEGPFEGYRVRVASTPGSAVESARRLVFVEVVFIGVLTLVLLGAIAVGVRYIARQVEVLNTKTSFVSNVTHELKTPVSVIKLAVETLEMNRFRDDREREKYLRTITRESDRLAQLVDNILDYSRLEAGQKQLHKAPTDLRDVVNSAMDSFRLRLDDAGFKTEVWLPETLPPVMADARAITHCLLNLLDNAVKYSRDRREVRVSVGSRDGMVTLSVADRGIGIPLEDQERVFEKFARAETGLVHDVKGAGLGLSLVQMLVRAHHGRVELVSTPGEGSTFTILLPVWDGGHGVVPA
jgi:signal transduction histidine kinase